MRNIFLFLFILGVYVPNAAGTEDFAKARERTRSWVISHAKGSLFPSIDPGPYDQAADLVDDLRVINLAEMERLSLLEAELPQSPWTDSYWPTYAGQIANRYADPDFNAALVWKYNRDYLLKNLGLGGEAKLSPAEKYDLLIGDRDFGLTKKMIESGAPHADAEGRVETWFGLCHGWAPASFMYPRPARAVAVTTPEGRELTFTPSDLKALATLLWANAGGRTRFIGGRCEEKEIELDPGNREKSADCFDTNPATWHLAVVNQIALGRRSFVMDISANQEVWNQPVYGYRYDYVNPNTNKWARKLKDAKVLLGNLKKDPYRKYRSARAVAVVRIAMEVSYVTETNPSVSAEDRPENDRHKLVSFTYDLELDEQDNIVGGEWLGNSHPDFLWLPELGAKAISAGDRWLSAQGIAGAWEAGRPLPALWVEAARYSAEHEQPLARIVDHLIELSRGQDMPGADL